MWLMPLLVILSAFFEYGMFITYNYLGHPWKDVLEASLEVTNIPWLTKEFSNRMAAQEMDGGKEVANMRPNRNVLLVSVEPITEVGKIF